MVFQSHTSLRSVLGFGMEIKISVFFQALCFVAKNALIVAHLTYPATIRPSFVPEDVVPAAVQAIFSGVSRDGPPRLAEKFFAEYQN
jgi:hypothetical protein